MINPQNLCVCPPYPALYWHYLLVLLWVILFAAMYLLVTRLSCSYRPWSTHKTYVYALHILLYSASHWLYIASHSLKPAPSIQIITTIHNSYHPTVYTVWDPVRGYQIHCLWDIDIHCHWHTPLSTSIAHSTQKVTVYTLSNLASYGGHTYILGTHPEILPFLSSPPLFF